MDDNEKKLDALILRARQMRKEYAGKLGERLRDLREACEEEEKSMSADSLADALTFLESVPDIRYPCVTIADGGQITIQWNDGPDETLIINFLLPVKVNFVIFSSDPQVSLSGSVAPEHVWEVAIRNGADKWALEPDKLGRQRAEFYAELIELSGDLVDMFSMVEEPEVIRMTRRMKETFWELITKYAPEKG